MGALQNCSLKKCISELLPQKYENKYEEIFTDQAITSTGVLFAPKSIYKTPLSANEELFNLSTAPSLLMPRKLHLKSTPFTFNIPMFFNSYAVTKTS